MRTPTRLTALALACAAALPLTASADHRASARATTGPQYIALASEPRTGPGYTWAASKSPYFGTGRRLLRYTVAVEKGLPTTAEDFAQEVRTILSDPRSWAANGHIVLQQVPTGASADFVLRLASPATTLRVCDDAFFSCGGPPPFGVVINSDRWLTSDPVWSGNLHSYRALLINHEVGHVLNFWHATCSTPGQLAPFMTLIRDAAAAGCVKSSWPYPSARNPDRAPRPIDAFAIATT